MTSQERSLRNTHQLRMAKELLKGPLRNLQVSLGYLNQSLSKACGWKMAIANGRGLRSHNPTFCSKEKVKVTVKETTQANERIPMGHARAIAIGAGTQVTQQMVAKTRLSISKKWLGQTGTLCRFRGAGPTTQ